MVRKIVEAMLFATNRPLTIKDMLDAFTSDIPDILEIQDALDELAAFYQDSAIELKRIASGYRFQVRETYAPWVANLDIAKPTRYSRALIETLAIIAYRQPVTRKEVEDIRGVGISPHIIQTLLDRQWIKVVGEKNTPGQPQLFATTKQFLDYFNLRSLNELPSIDALMAGEGMLDLGELGDRSGLF